MLCMTGVGLKNGDEKCECTDRFCGMWCESVCNYKWSEIIWDEMRHTNLNSKIAIAAIRDVAI